MAPLKTVSPLTKQREQRLARYRSLLRIAGICVATGIHYLGSEVLPHVTKPPKPFHTSVLTGDQWVHELLEGNERRFQEQLGLEKTVFKKLRTELKSRARLTRSRYVGIDEKIALFLYVVRNNASVRVTSERFQRSGDTVHRIVYSILDALTSPSFYGEYVKMPTSASHVPIEIRSNTKFFPFFKEARGAVDGSFIRANPKGDSRRRYRNRKGEIAQNVMGATGFDMKFSYILAGWEGSAADGTVYEDALTKGFDIPEGTYFLADAGYASCNNLLVPYRGVRYHLREWGLVGSRPANAKELFNLRHAQARNVVERLFGVVKRRWRILREANDWPVKTQSKFVLALAALHNFLRTFSSSREQETGEDAWEEEANEKRTMRGPRSQTSFTVSPAETREANERRDRIANEMWESYQTELRRRNARKQN